MTYARKIMLINFLIGILFLVDRLTKWLATKIPEGGVFLFSEKFAGLRLYKNFNLIFNITLPPVLMYVLIVVILLVLLWFLIKSYAERNLAFVFFLGLIMIGAVSNLFDRIYFGSVIDFIDFFDYSVFNLSDVYIVAGVGLIVISEVLNKRNCKLQ